MKSLSGAAQLDGAPIGWRADLIQARRPVVVLIAVPTDSLVVFAAAVAAFQQGFNLLP